MRIRAPLVATILLCFTLLSLDQLQSTEARAVHHDRVKRVTLSSEESRYLEYLYNNFLEVSNRRYRDTPNSKQFSVATINRPVDLDPCPLVMNNDLGRISPTRNNYLAYTPLRSPTRRKGKIHAETNIVEHYNDITENVIVRRVDLVSHYSPCEYCTDALRGLVREHKDTTFYIGYVEPYQNIKEHIGLEDNVRFGQISGSPPNCPPEHVFLSRSNTCPVIGKCPSISEVNNLLQIMIAG